MCALLAVPETCQWHSRPHIAEDIVSAILKTRASAHNPGVYWSREEQERQLEEAFQKWAARGVWNLAAAKTHKEQMKHVKKGCLTRPRSDVRSDGSRVEGTHKAWNSLQRSFASGLEMLTVLSHDLVLRRNHRVDLDSGSPTAFALSTYGSHHIRLVDRIAYLWNTIRQNTTHAHLFIGLQDTPRFRTVDSGESFGIVRSQFVEGYQYLVDVKEEEPDNLLDLSAQPADVAQQPLRSMNIDPALLSQPLVSSLAPIDGSASTFPSVRHTLGKGKVSVRHTLATIICTRLGTARSWRRHTPADSKQGTLTSSTYALLKVEITGLTPSQQVFSISTGLNPLSMVIPGGDEFFLFMNLRAEHQWASHSMTPRKWVEAAEIYNTELEKTKHRLGYYGWTVKKTPRALMDKLGEIESMVLRRLSAGDYKCKLSIFMFVHVSALSNASVTAKESRSEDFWKKHCHAVPLFKGGSDDMRKVSHVAHLWTCVSNRVYWSHSASSIRARAASSSCGLVRVVRHRTINVPSAPTVYA
ncbi:uncharacterized protein TRAVEDRAFT_137340 [Trametes versicolor FP-101664 SS1]|uniref:Uncharacterized protein n=1 Tax=Trametes versicolor (strain FP-101664) TaxID=717944 RepID=R7S6D3_TRAVS|nr:uncharacterized protein TRAVEDRAFT_137340 [Trametes versicolor FP-101664 SS1]EIW51483.1 hypothetical protein TRAVEDRAFT_137340 [Trametes versicolor FP-101664 SS1]